MNPGDQPAAYLGIDLGTSSLKLTVVGSDGTVLAEAEETYDVRVPQPGYAETDPRDWAAALDRAARRLAGSRWAAAASSALTAVAVTGQMHGIVLTGPDGRPVRPALLWPDQRSADLLSRWRALSSEARCRLSNPLVAGMAGPLLTWLRQNEPASLDRASTVASPKDWLRRELTGSSGTERSDASATLLWDVVADSWSPEAVALAGIAPGLLPTVVSSDAVVGTTAEAGALGVIDGCAVPVVAGAADTAAALVALEASGAVRSWQEAVVVNAGTGIQIVRPGAEPAPRADPVTHLYADAAGGWYEMLAIQNGGFALTWAQRALAATWEESVALAQEAAPGSAGAVFLPFLTGERGGVAPTGASAGWTSLTPSAGRAELLRAAFEGYAFTIRRGIEMLADHSGPVVLSGGGGREPWVRQLLADVLDRPVTYVAMRSASAIGAAVLAARGMGHHLPVTAPVLHVEPARGSHGEELQAAYARWQAGLDGS